MNKINSKLFKKFENQEIKNLAACMGGTTHETCGLVSANCEDEAGSLINGVYDDVYDFDSDCNDTKTGGTVIGPVVVAKR